MVNRQFSLPEDFLRDLGNRLRRLRQDAGLTQSLLAGKANIATTTVQRIESGRKGETDSLAAMFIALGMGNVFENLAPENDYSPLQAMRSAKQRQRVRLPRKPTS